MRHACLGGPVLRRFWQHSIQHWIQHWCCSVENTETTLISMPVNCYGQNRWFFKFLPNFWKIVIFCKNMKSHLFCQNEKSSIFTKFWKIIIFAKIENSSILSENRKICPALEFFVFRGKSKCDKNATYNHKSQRTSASISWGAIHILHNGFLPHFWLPPPPM